MFRSIRLALSALLLSAMTAAAQEMPTRVIVFIGDGVGVSYWTVARFAQRDLAATRFNVMGLVDTRSSDAWITDSAAGATAYSAGVRTYNGAIGVAADSVPVKTVLEEARDLGWATGLVATSSVTHATPASFAAHVVSRQMEFDIAEDLVESRADVLLGGGRQWFDPERRPDGQDLLGAIQRSHTFVSSAEELRSVDASTRRLVGLFAENQMPAAAGRSPSLPDMTRAALDVLDRDEEGFFLMVEASQPDWRGHDNASVELVRAEMLDYDRALAVALDYQEAHPGTLILAVADHETGGMAVVTESEGTTLTDAAEALAEGARALRYTTEMLPDSVRAEAAQTAETARAFQYYLLDQAGDRAPDEVITLKYAAGHHTAQMIPLFAKGPGAARFGGIHDNWQVGRMLMELVRR